MGTSNFETFLRALDDAKQDREESQSEKDESAAEEKENAAESVVSVSGEIGEI